jgi:mono/diheme cytochrome c family protein
VQVIAAGVGGTAMPSWGESLTDKQLWGLAYYVESLVQKRASAEAVEMKKALLSQPPFALPAEKNPQDEKK